MHSISINTSLKCEIGDTGCLALNLHETTHTHTHTHTYMYVAAPALSYNMGDLVQRPGIEPGPPALGAWSLSHGATREVPETSLFKRLQQITFSLYLNNENI